MSQKEFEGQAVLVTGAASGIGLATALAFAREGASVALMDKDAATLKLALERVSEHANAAIAESVDVTDDEAIGRFVARVENELGPLRCAVNSAGVGGQNVPFVDVSDALFDQTMAVNTKGLWYCMKHQIKAMLNHGQGGAIANVSSGAAIVNPPGFSAYTASKYAVIGLTKTAAAEYAAQGIRVNVLCPGSVDTPMFSRAIESIQDDAPADTTFPNPIQRISQAEEQADALLFMCSQRSSFMIGHTLIVDGGQAIV